MSFSNTTLTDQESSWINECCGRLRLIQADAATALPEKRIEYLREEIDRSFQDVPPADRKRYLEALISRFPVAGQIPALENPPSSPTPETFEQIAEHFFALAATLEGPRKQELVERLQKEGLCPPAENAGPPGISDDSRVKLGLAPSQGFDPARVATLAALLVEEICLLDKAALKTMRELSPRSQLLKRSEPFRGSVSRYLEGKEQSVETQLHEIRALWGGLLAALQGGGKDFGREFVSHLSPYAIEDIIVGEGGARFLGPNKKERCWDKYRDLVGDYSTLDQVDKKIRDCMGAFVDRLLADKR